MRVHDQAPPTVAPHPFTPGSPLAAWPVALRIGLERLPQAAYVWDDDDDTIVWDDPDPDRLVWDAPFIGDGYTDVTCDFTGFEAVAGEPDEHGIMDVPSVTLNLRDPGDGRYRSRTVDGRLTYWAPGRRLSIWVDDPDTGPWWVFNGRITVWRDTLAGDVTIEAYAGGAELAQDPPGDWTAGVAGDYPSERIVKILTRFAYTGARRLDVGRNPLAVDDPNDSPPLDALVTVALSDGGVIMFDADDTLLYRDRDWRAGRPDQTFIRTFTDNVCAVPAVLWDVELADDDTWLAGTVELENVAGLTAVAVAPVDGVSAPAWMRWSPPESGLWQTQADGNELARHIVTERALARAAIALARLYLHDPRQDLWPWIDTRLGDLVNFTTDQPVAGGDIDVMDITAVVSTVRHFVTPDAWTMELATTPAVAYATVELWDRTRFVWDDPDPLAVWRY